MAPTSNSESAFSEELEVFRHEAESAVQFFYAWLSIHQVAQRTEQVEDLLNRAPLLWNTVLGALQSSVFIALGRVFDQEQDTHNVDRLLRMAQQNLHMFSLEALAERKRNLAPTADEWLGEYLARAYVASPDDFRRLRKHVAARRRVYEANFRPVRHQIFAHKQLSEQVDASALFAKVSLPEIQQVLVFLRRLHQALWNLLFNGQKPVLRPARYSVTQMLAQPRPYSTSLQERLTRETAEFLKSTASAVASAPTRR
jgi:signal transduction histidine kinase